MKRGGFNIFPNTRTHTRLSPEDFEKQMRELEGMKFEKKKRKILRKPKKP